MQISKSERFVNNLYAVLDFIAKDSLSRALDFKDKLDKEIYSLSDNPYRCRKSIHFNDQNIRDLVFMGYVAPYLVDQERNEILLLGIVNRNLW